MPSTRIREWASRRRIAASFVLGLLIVAGWAGASHVATSHVDDPVGDQTLLGGPASPCQQVLSDITSLDVSRSETEVTIRLGVVDLERPEFRCQGAGVGALGAGKPVVFYELELMQDFPPGPRVWVSLNGKGHGQGEWVYACGSLHFDTPGGSVWFSECMGNVVFQQDALTLRFPLTGTARHYWTGERVAYALSGSFSPSGTTASAWQPPACASLTCGIVLLMRDQARGPDVHL